MRATRSVGWASEPVVGSWPLPVDAAASPVDAVPAVEVVGEDDDVVLGDDDVDSAGVPGGAVVVGVGGPGITSETTAELFSALLSVSVPVMVTLFG